MFKTKDYFFCESRNGTRLRAVCKAITENSPKYNEMFWSKLLRSKLNDRNGSVQSKDPNLGIEPVIM